MVFSTKRTTSTSITEIWQEIDLFFMQQGKVYTTLRTLANRLQEKNIDYAIIDGMALVFHGYVRLTQDVDVLLAPEGLEEFRRSMVGKGFVPAFTGATRMFKDTATGVTVEIITSGEFPGDGLPKPISFPSPKEVSIVIEGIDVVNLEKLIELKLASGISAADRLKDLADIQELIRVNKLPVDLASNLNSYVRGEYLRLWHSVNG